MDNLATAGVKAIMVSAVDPKATDVLDKIAGETALFTTDSDAPNSKRIAYIGRPTSMPGKQAAEIAKKAMPNGAKCMGSLVCSTAANFKERAQGFTEGLAGTNITLVDTKGDGIDQTRAKANVSDVLAANPDINCMVGFYSYNTPRIYEALKDAGQLGKITVVGFDDDSDHPGRHQGRHHRRHRGAAAVRVGLSGLQADGGRAQGRQVGHPGQWPADRSDQDPVCGDIDASAGRDVRAYLPASS